MQLYYHVKLPDHDFVVAENHKLSPSVYAGIIMKKYSEGNPDAVAHSGTTYVKILSGKHTSANAETHVTDINRLPESPAIENLMRARESFVLKIIDVLW